MYARSEEKRPGKRTVVGEVEAAVDPDAALVDIDVVLRPHRPLSGDGYPFALHGWRQTEGSLRTGGRGEAYLCALSANHGGGTAGGKRSGSEWRLASLSSGGSCCQGVERARAGPRLLEMCSGSGCTWQARANVDGRRDVLQVVEEQGWAAAGLSGAIRAELQRPIGTN